MDHPRSRGVYRLTEAVRVFRRGSSPLARGLPVEQLEAAGAAGIIPARAGFTCRGRRGGRRRRDHPRSRGVYIKFRTVLENAIGSSPLARGLPNEDPEKAAFLGIIPARAGFTRTRTSSDSDSTDHPRSRGVYAVDEYIEKEGSGSSPLARGLPTRLHRRHHRHGIIPARAGFTGFPAHPRVGGPDHPRSRGVYRRAPTRPPWGRGSSPLARGLRGDCDPRPRIFGIIPARAGFTPGDLNLRHALEDHPRSRGVYWATATTTSSRPGSSPLARGLQEERNYGDDGTGIIPARAGFTPGRPWPAPGTPDHPRSRGVY